MRRLWFALLVAIPALLGACNRLGSRSAIEGTLTRAAGSGAPLTAGASVGTNFQIEATLAEVAVSETGGEWRCFAPAPPHYPEYEIDATDGTSFLFALVVSTSHWHAGSIAIDGSNVRLQLSLPDRYGVATNGTLVLASAGTAVDSSGSRCSFRIDGAHLSGWKQNPPRSAR